MADAQRVSPSRIAALDLARFVALAGMFAAHTWSSNQDGTETLIGDLVAGRAAALFAVLAGIGVVLVTRGSLARGDRGAAVRTLIARGLVVLLIGLLLGFIETNIYIVIAYYGLLFIVMAPLVLLRTPWLILIAGILAIVGPVANQAVRGDLGVDFELGSPDLLDAGDPIVSLRALLVTGIYPVITWVVYGLVGVVIGRALLSATTARATRILGARLLAGGAVAAAIGAAVGWWVLDLGGGRVTLLNTWAGGEERLMEFYLDRSGEGAPVAGDPLWLAAATPHTGTTPDLLVTAGLACAIIGLLLAALPDPTPRTRLVLLPFLGAGAAPLTVYTVHVVVTSGVADLVALSFGRDAPFALTSSPGLWILNLVVALLLGTALRLMRVRGPLEALVTSAGRLASGAGRRRGAVSSDH